VTFRPIAAIVLVSGTLLIAAPGAARYMPVAEIRVGMIGVGRTVFQGTAIEEFRAHILGVMRSTIGPQRDLILARLEGGPLAKSGVIAGMSGSPVYIDGRLVGAVSYSLGLFATEPIAGITPIGEMIEATTPAPEGAAPRIEPIPIGAGITALTRALDDALRPARSFVTDQSSVQAPGGLPTDLPDTSMLRPIALPLTISGIGTSAAELGVAPLSNAGFVPVPGESRRWPQEARSDGMLRPGDPVGIALITGDLQLGATGTVTEVDGSRIYAFGHALYNLGQASFAMTRAYVHAVLPSLSSSMKLTSLGEVVGAVQQDRATAVAGVFGDRPRTLPMTVTLSREGGVARRFSFALAENRLLTPLLAYTALTSILAEHEHEVGPATFAVRARTAIAGHQTLVLDDVYAGDQPGTAAAAAIAMPISTLLTNDMEPVRLESLSLEIKSAERLRTATLDRIWLDSADVQRGKTVTVKILVSPWRGQKAVRTLEIEIPRNAEGPLTLVVADGVRFGQWEQREQRAQLAPDTLDQMIKILNETRRGNRLYIRLLGRDAGTVVNGEAMPSLPSSVLAVMQGDRGAAPNPVLQTSTLGAWEIPMDQAVAGLRSMTIPLPPTNRCP
jgi:hypothetical protein